MKIELHDVEIRLVSPDRQSMDSVRTVFRNSGFSHVAVRGTIDDLQDALESSLVDLVVCDTWFPEGDPCRMVRNFRQNKFGYNPFLPVIMFARDPVPALVKQVADSGADCLMALPLSASLVTDKVNTLIHRRKPFIVSSDYVGPDRRQKPRPGPNQSPLIDVPNVLRDKATGTLDPTALQRQISRSITAVNQQKLVCNASEIAAVVDTLSKYYAGQLPSHDIGGELDRLISMSRDMERRMGSASEQSATEPCQALRELAMRIRASMAAPAEEDLGKLSRLAEVVRATFCRDMPDETAAGEGG